MFEKRMNTPVAIFQAPSTSLYRPFLTISNHSVANRMFSLSARLVGEAVKPVNTSSIKVLPTLSMWLEEQQDGFF
jgi:hypothetical protein